MLKYFILFVIAAISENLQEAWCLSITTVMKQQSKRKFVLQWMQNFEIGGLGGGINCLALIYPSWIKAMWIGNTYQHSIYVS